MRLDNTEWFEAMRRYVSLSGLCVQEPGVAARRINKLNERIAQLEAERAELVEIVKLLAGSDSSRLSHCHGCNNDLVIMAEDLLAKHKEQSQA